MTTRILSLFFATFVVSLLLIFIGPASIPFEDVVGQLVSFGDDNIIWLIRLPKMVTSFVAGAALGVCGLLMQTYFQNPLAGPFVLGISSGSSLGVALWIMASSFLPSFLYRFGLSFAAIAGAISVLLLMVVVSHRFASKVVLLVMGLVFGYFTSGVINLLVVASSAHKIKTYLLWTLGSFNRVIGYELIIFAAITFGAILFSLLLIRSLNALSMGDDYARSMGIDLVKTRWMVLTITAILTGLVTSYCGPIAFLGIIVPHLVRTLFKSGEHRLTLPMCALMGGLLAQAAELVSTSFPFFTIPINAVMGLIGAPLIIFFLLRNRGARE